MKILGIESSGLVAGAAIVEEGIIKAEFSVANKLTHSETLLPLVREMFDLSGIELDEIDSIAVSAGPGSFTGLRIGVATAKGLALALNIPVIKIGSLEAMGKPLSLISKSLICPMMDARNHQVYSAAYIKNEEVIAEDACGIKEFLSKIADYVLFLESYLDSDFPICFFGDGADVYKSIILDYVNDISLAAKSRKLCIKPYFALAPFNRQRASSVAFLGEKYYREWLDREGLSALEVKERGADGIKCFDERVINSDDLIPIYLRKSQAQQNLEKGKLPLSRW